MSEARLQPFPAEPAVHRGDPWPVASWMVTPKEDGVGLRARGREKQSLMLHQHHGAHARWPMRRPQGHCPGLAKPGRIIQASAGVGLGMGTQGSLGTPLPGSLWEQPAWLPVLPQLLPGRAGALPLLSVEGKSCLFCWPASGSGDTSERLGRQGCRSQSCMLGEQADTGAHRKTWFLDEVWSFGTPF